MDVAGCTNRDDVVVKLVAPGSVPRTGNIVERDDPVAGHRSRKPGHLRVKGSTPSRSATVIRPPSAEKVALFEAFW